MSRLARRAAPLVMVFVAGFAAGFLVKSRAATAAATKVTRFPTEWFTVYEAREGNSYPLELHPYSATVDGVKVRIADDPRPDAKRYILSLDEGRTLVHCQQVTRSLP